MEEMTVEAVSTVITKFFVAAPQTEALSLSGNLWKYFENKICHLYLYFI